MRLLFLILFFSTSTFSQDNYPQDYFRSPLDIPIQLSGNFGELRPNHFHAGFDIKTQQKEGLNVYAVADGYVSRIKISIYGYGKAIYITHANGYTSVYGHLQKAVGTIQEKIVQLQYNQKAYEIEAFFKPNELQVTKGQIIAISGNTGGSEGPHLHFEFRENKTEKAINPLLFGLKIKDTKKPTVTNLLVYPIDKEAIVNSSKKPIALNLSLQADGTYVSEKVIASGKIGFGIVASDYDDVSFNNNGIFKTQVISNGKTIFKFELDKLAFDEARYVNAFIDYDRYKKMRNRVQKLFMKNPYKLSNIKYNVDNGIINVIPNYMDTEKIEVLDFDGNITSITIPVSYSVASNFISNEEKTTKFFIKAKADTNFEKDNFSVYFPANTFYEDFYMNFNVINNLLILHEDVVPAHTNFTITVEDTVSSESEKNKMFIATVNGNKLSYNATNLVGNTFTCKARTLGQFKLAKDTIAPKISIAKPIQDKWITNLKTIVITISDDLSGVKTYNGYINDKWILLEYENKLKRLTHTFDDSLLLEGKNNLKIVVTDNVGNSTTFETQFNRSQKK